MTTLRVNKTVATLVANRVRRETFEGRKHVVAPVVLLVEGVHVGSGGPVFYPADEIERSASRWNGTPFTVGHPTVDDKLVSAKTPGILDQFGLGWVFNAKYDPMGRRVVAEVWIDEEKARRIAPKVLSGIELETLEVSTGVFDVADGIPGMWKGEPFDSTVRNYQSDHLAGLSDTKGACSRADGCGVRAAAAQGGSMTTKPTVFVRARKLVSDLMEALSDDEPEVPVANQTTGIPPATNEKKEESVANKDLVDKLVGCACTGFAETDRPALSALEDTQLTKLVAMSDKIRAAQETPPPPEPAPAPEAPPAPPAPETPPASSVTEAQFVANAPPAIAASLRRALARDRAQKNELITSLVANERCKFTKDQLEAKEIEELETLSELGHIKVNYSAVRGEARLNEDAIKKMPDVMDALRAQKV